MAKILDNITLENYRGHKATSVSNINDLLMLVGKNDVGKSSVLEALNVFFNAKKINYTLALSAKKNELVPRYNFYMLALTQFFYNLVP